MIFVGFTGIAVFAEFVLKLIFCYTDGTKQGEYLIATERQIAVQINTISLEIGAQLFISIAFAIVIADLIEDFSTEIFVEAGTQRNGSGIEIRFVRTVQTFGVDIIVVIAEANIGIVFKGVGSGGKCHNRNSGHQSSNSISHYSILFI